MICALFLFALFSCSNEQPREDSGINKSSDSSIVVEQNALVEGTQCYLSDNRLSARSMLIQSFMNDIDAIVTDSSMAQRTENMLYLEGGQFRMGGRGDLARNDEFPVHDTEVSDFWIGRYEVTNAAYKKFVDATGYLTVAERQIDSNEILAQLPPGTNMPPDIDLAPFSLVFKAQPANMPGYYPSQWWTMVKGADWLHPEGPESSIVGREDHPVIHISWYDAIAYCKWSGCRLPTEAEWEFAAKNRGRKVLYPWGDQSVDSTKANFWQGDFPVNNLVRDEYYKSAPVGTFGASPLGLYDLAGNVWEWCQDWYHHDYYTQAKGQSIVENPLGPVQSFDPQEPGVPKKVVRGGSFLCNDSYCSGYRSAARMKTSPDTGLEHTGFRVARSVSAE